MPLHSYIVEHDMGFAPNPFHGVCTLAACKPRIRKYAKLGDYVIGTGTKKRGVAGRLVYVMKVSKIITFDEYWRAGEFVRKKPVMNGSVAQRYGDNIYHRDPLTGEWIQEDSFHSKECGVLHRVNLKTDTGSTEQILIGDWFIYWGGDGPIIPNQFKGFVHKGIGHRKITDEESIAEFLKWANRQGAVGVNGDPCEWRYPPKAMKLAS